VATELQGAGFAIQEEPEPAGRAAQLLADGKTVGWFQGRMEFGPRTLGNRCLLINPNCPDGGRVKRRDYLKPFGIAILETQAGKYLSQASPSPFMSFMDQIRSRHRQSFEGVLLNNYCRYQTVNAENGLFHSLLAKFDEQTGQPFLINTSLNAEGSPIIASPRALAESLDTLGLDALLAENLYVELPRNEDPR
jgi:carbamoyltransferase